MGESKRRKMAMGEEYGKGIRYYAWIKKSHLDARYISIMAFMCDTVPGVRDKNGFFVFHNFEAIHKTNLIAVSKLGLIAFLIRYPDNPHYARKLKEVMGEDSIAQIRRLKETYDLGDDFVIELHGILINIDNCLAERGRDYPYFGGVFGFYC